MKGLLALAFGWGWAEIDNCPLSLANEYARYLMDHPPADFLVAAYFGIKPKRKAPVDQQGNVVFPIGLEGVMPGVRSKDAVPEQVREFFKGLTKEKKNG